MGETKRRQLRHAVGDRQCIAAKPERWVAKCSGMEDGRLYGAKAEIRSGGIDVLLGPRIYGITDTEICNSDAEKLHRSRVYRFFLLSQTFFKHFFLAGPK